MTHKGKLFDLQWGRDVEDDGKVREIVYFFIYVSHFNLDLCMYGEIQAFLTCKDELQFVQIQTINIF